MTNLAFYCDKGRHLVCWPYSVSGLHQMAHLLGIKRAWFHNKPGRHHYDIPVGRLAEIMRLCTLVSSREVLAIIGTATPPHNPAGDLYLYLGDGLSSCRWRWCRAVYTAADTVVRGRNRNQLVLFDGVPVVVAGRHLRRMPFSLF